MAVLTLLSAKGSPGATTLTVALTLAWAGANPGRRAVALDMDPLGGDMAAGVLRGGVDPQEGILRVATSRDGDPALALDSAAISLRPDGSARVVPGVPDRARAHGLTLAWDVLAAGQPHEEGTDLLVDAGRVESADAGRAPWLADCAQAILVVRPTLPGVAAANRLVRQWREADLSESTLRVLVVEAPAPYSANDAARVLGLPLAGVVPFDPHCARVHSEGAPAHRGFARSGYVRAIDRLAAELGRAAVGRAERLAALDPVTTVGSEPVPDGRLR